MMNTTCYRLVVCEKPSVARSIASVLGACRREDGFLSGGGYLVSWCFGHLAELSDADAYDEKYGKWRREDLPILPESWQYTVARDKQKQMNTLRALMHREDVCEVVNACDAGREGELIFRTAYNLNNCRKRVKRLWISSMEDAAILHGFDNLKNVKFKEMDSKGYDEFKDRLSDITMYIDDEMDNLMRVQEILNDLLLILYTNDEKEEDNVVKGCDEIIKNTNLLFLNKFSSKSLEEIEDMFVMLEGEQEKIYPHLSAYDITDQIKESYADKIKQLDLVEEYNIVFKLPKLNSDSMFVKLDKVENNDVVDEAYLENQKEQLINDYRELFKDTDKMITRAVMAQALSELPIFFNNISELQDYIYNTLSICNDKAEKLACIEIINGIMAG